MKLQLKHIAPYLPYNLEYNSQGEFDSQEYADILPKPTIFEMKNLGEMWVESECGHSGFLEDTLPLLHPLSTLTTEIEHNGEKFIPLERLQLIFSKRLRFDKDGFYNHENKSVVNRGGDKAFTFNQLEAYSYLFEWHIDLFGLIDAGLAIEKKTQEK